MKTPTLSAIEQTVFTLANEQYEILLNTIRSPEYQALEHGDVEQFVHQEGTELLRRLFQGHLDLRAANEVQYQNLVGSDRQTRPHHRQNTHRQLETLFGEVVVTRVGYSTKTPGVSALYPADGILNLATDSTQTDGYRCLCIQHPSLCPSA